MSHRLIAAMALMMPLATPTYAFEPTDFEGVWMSNIRNNDRGTLGFDLRIIGDVGTLKLDATRWGEIGSGTCAYAFAVADSSIEQLTINPAASIAKNCPNTLPFALRRQSVDELTMSISDDVKTLMGGLGDITLFGTLRPLRDHERHAAIPNLDILGIAPAMSRADAESRLDELGFEKIKDAVAAYKGDYESVSEHWSRNPNGDGVNTDHISISYNGIRLNGSDAEKIVAISRYNEPLEPLSLAVFENAITEKYGPPPRSGDRAFFRDGRPVILQNNERCQAEIHQDIRFSHAVYNRFSTSGGRGTKNFSTNCAAVISVLAVSNPNTGTVTSYSMTIHDIDMIWEDFWNRWSAVEGDAIASQFQALNALGTAKPEL